MRKCEVKKKEMDLIEFDNANHIISVCGRVGGWSGGE